MATADDRQRLSAIRTRHADASTDWQLGPIGTELLAVFYPKTPPVCIAELTVDCGIRDREFLVWAYEDTRFLLKLLDEAFAEIRRWKRPTGRESSTRTTAATTPPNAP